MQDIWNEYDSESHPGLAVTESGWQWIEENESRFILHRPDRKKEYDSPF
jgi:hypothetical protein